MKHELPPSAIIYRMVRKAAEMGDPCPSNAVLATACGFASISSPAAYLQRLQRDGILSVEVRQQSRVVTFPDGLATKDVGRDVPHWRRPGARRRAHEDAKSHVAECLANGGTIADAAKSMGVGYERARTLFRAVCADLGWQAQ